MDLFAEKNNFKNKLQVIYRIFDDIIIELESIAPLPDGDKLFKSKDLFEWKITQIKNNLRSISSMEAELIPEVERLEKNVLSAIGLKEFRSLSGNEKEAIAFFGALSSELSDVVNKLDEYQTLCFGGFYDFVKAGNKIDEVFEKTKKFLEYITILLNLFDQIESIEKTKNIIRKAA